MGEVRRENMAGRYYEARLRAMEASTAMAPRARSECPRGRNPGFGSPDYRSSSIEINTGRLSKRVISVTSLHSNDRVPLYLGGDFSREATVVRDSYSPCPSSIGTRPQSYRVASSHGSPYVGCYRYQYGIGAHKPPPAPTRVRSPSPVRYSVQPRFRSRFYN